MYFKYSKDGAVITKKSQRVYAGVRFGRPYHPRVFEWLLLVWEVPHPLSVSRKHAIYVVRGALFLVLDRPQVHAMLLDFFGKGR